ncbi:ComEC/Rec2 family competence protein [Dickeya undicola]|uniref:hypothetical protein n=1 Tax=Dickeya undicola TaxID=1577887 RepID=UPI000AA8AD35|nr:hypothetical protein [Dickeya undicola]
MTCKFIIYNVALGQCIGVVPEDNNYAMMVDCGHDDNFHPIDDFKKYLPRENNKECLRSLIITNYDHDHFSDLPRVNGFVDIKSVLLPNNLSMNQIRDLKSESTTALDTLEDIRNRYTSSVENYNPPFTKKRFLLQQDELREAGIPIETNHLSQMIFIKYGDITICIPGDLERRSWELMLSKTDVQSWLGKSNIFVAAHHGRENGYHAGVFDYCQPDCVIISDKEIIHGTQNGMSNSYSNHVRSDGVVYTSGSGDESRRKVLTTRNDGHILVTVPSSGMPTFRAYSI